MELGNELVLEHGFDPAMDQPVSNQNTQAIKNFAEWLNSTPEARQVLAQKGVEWPVVEGKYERKNP
jgi:hypothetical protein